MLADGVVRGDGVDVVLGVLEGLCLLAEFGGDHDLAFVEGGG